MHKTQSIPEEIVTLSLGFTLALFVWTASGTPVVAAECDAASADETKVEGQETASDSSSHCESVKKANYKKVACLHPHAACPESEQVIETLKTISHLYSEGNFDELSNFVDDGITTFDEKSNKLIVGKQAVMEDIKKRWSSAHDSGNPILSFTINHPYAKVTGDHAVVTFEGVKTIGGKNPETLVSRCTDMFVKKDGTWKKLYYRSSWKKGKPTGT